MIQTASSAEVHSADSSTVDTIVRALYEAISFRPGGQPNYTRIAELCHPSAQFVPPKPDRESPTPVLTVNEFITQSRELVVISGLERRGFIESEIARRILSYGNILHVFSTYESRHTQKDAAPIQRGINSIQMIRERGRWWIISVVWDVETPGNPIPKAYLV